MAKKSKQVQEAAAATRAVKRDATVPRAKRRPEVVRRRKEERLQQYEKQQRQWFYTRIAIGGVAAIIVGALAWGAWGQYQEWQVSRDVDAYFDADDFVGQHREDVEILYEQIPPVGGVHKGLWQNCGFYGEYIDNARGVHALEHGAVWITYDPDLPQDQIDHLESLTDQQFVLVSPYPGMDAPVVASVWGKQIKLDGAFDDRLEPFINRYRKNPDNSPEQQGICWSGVSATTDVVPQQAPYVRADPDGPPIGGITAPDATATANAMNPGATPPAATPPATTGTAATPPASTPASTPAATPVGTPATNPAATPAT
jgi:hypothetical protein